MQNMMLCGLAAMALVGGCGTAPQASTEPQDRGEIVTGSNIPRKKGQAPTGVERVSPADLQRSRDAAGGTAGAAAR
jgi:hypothetical protein